MTCWGDTYLHDIVPSVSNIINQTEKSLANKNIQLQFGYLKMQSLLIQIIS
jgi:hypothetical protein